MTTNESFRLYHAGPYPLGATYLADVPIGMTLKQIGAELLAAGGWVLGGPWSGRDAGDVRSNTAEYDGSTFLDFQLFALSPSEGPDFALAVEATTAVRNHGKPYLVLTIYLIKDAIFGSTPRGANVKKLGFLFSEGAKAMRTKACRDDPYPHGAEWDRDTGRAPTPESHQRCVRDRACAGEPKGL